MNVLFAAPRGLYADAFGFWLTKLAPDVRLLRCDADPASIPDHASGLRLMLLDVDAVPVSKASTTVRGFSRRVPSTRLVVLGSPLDEAFAVRLIAAGARAYLPKSSDEAYALQTLRAVVAETAGSARAASTASLPDAPTQACRQSRSDHPYGLTARELDLLAMACHGQTNLEISKRRGISVGVVKIHLHHAYQKLGVPGRVQAIRMVEQLDAIRQLHVQGADRSPALVDWLLPHMMHERHRKGDVLFRKGEPGHAMYYVQQGRVRLPEIGATMTQGDLFGELGIFAPTRTRTSGARCETDAHLFTLTGEQTKRLCFENPRFGYYLIGLIAERLVDERARQGLQPEAPIAESPSL